MQVQYSFAKHTLISVTLVCSFLFGAMLVSCTQKDVFEPNYEQAVGIIVLPESEVPQDLKVYAEEKDRLYTFGQNGAAVFFFDISADESVAGDQYLIANTFAANMDDDSIISLNVAGFRSNADPATLLYAFYLYYDGEGLYYETNNAFWQGQVKDGLTIDAHDYECTMELRASEPADSFTARYMDASGVEIGTETFELDKLEDPFYVDASADVASVDVVAYSADGAEIETKTLTPDEASTVLCVDDGVFFLDSKIILVDWSMEGAGA